MNEMMWTGAAGLCASLALLAGPGAAAAETYRVLPESRIVVHVGKAGLFKFAGHEHEVVGHTSGGEVVADEAELSRSSVSLAFDARALTVSAKDEPPEDVPKVQAKMLGPEVLDTARFPEVTFRSVSVSGAAKGAGEWDLQVAGDLTIHGVTKHVAMPVHATKKEGMLTVSGHVTIRHTDFEMKPVSVAGVVKVKDELGLDFEITAAAR